MGVINGNQIKNTDVAREKQGLAYHQNFSPTLCLGHCMTGFQKLFVQK